MTTRIVICFFLLVTIAASTKAEPLPPKNAIAEKLLKEIVALKKQHLYLEDMTYEEHVRTSPSTNHGQLTFEFNRLPDKPNPNHRQGLKGSSIIKQYGPNGGLLRVYIFKGPWRGALAMHPARMQRIGDFNIVIIARGPKGAELYQSVHSVIEKKANSWGIPSTKHPEDKTGD